MLILSLASLLAVILGMQVVLRIRAELSPLVACSAVLLFLYAAALTGWLVAGLWTFYFISLIFAALAIRRVKTLPAPDRQPIIVVDLVFLALALVAWVSLHEGRYNSWDEFSHWGRVAKAISIEGALPTPLTGVLLLDYPPGAALFHYFVLGGQFSEGGTYFAQSLILIASGLALTVWRGVRGLPLAVCTLVAIFLVLSILGPGVATVELDHVLGAVFGAAVGSYVVGNTHDRRTVVALVAVLGVLPLLKPVGLLLAVSGASVMVLNGIATAVRDRRRPVAANEPRPRRWTWAMIWLAAFMVPIVVHQSWQSHVARLNVGRTFAVEWTTGRLAVTAIFARRTVRNYRRALDITPVGRFGNGTIHQRRWIGSPVGIGDLPPPASTRQWFFVLLGGSAIAVLFHRESMSKYVIAHGSLAAGCLAYLTTLLYAYLFNFGSYEGPRLISFGRYAGTWFLAWTMVILASLGSVRSESRLRHLAALVLLVGVLGWATVRMSAQPGMAVLHVRAVVQSIVGRIERFLPQGARTYVIWQRTNGLEFHLMSYELSPRRTNPWCWTFGEPFVENDVWTCRLSPEEVRTTIADYDYVLIGRADDLFWETYQGLFASDPGQPPPRGYLFKVDRSGSRVMLKQVATH